MSSEDDDLGWDDPWEDPWDGPWDGSDPEDDDDGGSLERIPKPDELLALHRVSAELFEILRGWFEVPDEVGLNLAEIDSAVAELGDPQMVAALAMRKLQALHLLATPGVVTVTDVVVSIINDLERALIQAPNMWLKRRAAATDWDGALAALAPEDGDAGEADGGGAVGSGGDGQRASHPSGGGEPDEIERFRYLHLQLHEALFAVVEASEGEIRELE